MSVLLGWQFDRNAEFTFSIGCYDLKIKSQNGWLLRSRSVDRQTAVLVIGYFEKTCVRFLGVAPVATLRFPH
ncbi:hypothetical protein QUA54_06855 [Microcoleus sp. MOSTC5]|uniref:hypothetical protein n=1 Tax=Microcoleus sp. MOSTC5 TaxID=3055378 RepID=UPI002FCE6ADE